ncbi:Hypothetical predicted protein [Octopus vulgaris]|uniref:Uncharacterized protein n=1 Tax=Octopus vulgaris TaxID=6645 RepID=A0AA36AM84_OCTVU|nr:Hypothetical predicted protein [Octopus vulgaris]
MADSLESFGFRRTMAQIERKKTKLLRSYNLILPHIEILNKIVQVEEKENENEREESKNKDNTDPEKDQNRVEKRQVKGDNYEPKKSVEAGQGSPKSKMRTYEEEKDNNSKLKQKVAQDRTKILERPQGEKGCRPQVDTHGQQHRTCGGKVSKKKNKPICKNKYLLVWRYGDGLQICSSQPQARNPHPNHPKARQNRSPQHKKRKTHDTITTAMEVC